MCSENEGLLDGKGYGRADIIDRRWVQGRTRTPGGMRSVRHADPVHPALSCQEVLSP